MRPFLSIILILLPFIALHAQSSNEAKAEKLILDAQGFIKKNKPDKAERAFLKAVKTAPYYPKTYSALGDFYCSVRQYSKAVDVFKDAENSCRECSRLFAIPLATALCNAKQYAEAEAVLANWKDKNSISGKRKSDYKLLNANIQFGKYAMTHQVDSAPVDLGLRVNSEFDEYFPSISPDDSILYFTRRTGGIDEDFYVSMRDSCDHGAWLSALDMGSPPNTPQQEGAQYISADGHYLFFQRCDNRSINGWEGGGCDLYFSYTDSTGRGWVQPVPFGYTINTVKYEGMPSLSSDNRELFFVSDREGGYGGKDIWVSEFKNGLWQLPQNLGPEINTPFDESAPYIAPDNNTLYFTSNGLPGMGGNDIYMSRRNANGIWQQPVNLGYPINTEYEEVSFCISAGGAKGYMASDRPGGYGNMDLYEVALPHELRPEPFTYVVGATYDSLSKDRITYAQIEWDDTVNGEPVYQFQSNRGDGSFMSAIPVNKPFAVNAYRSGYHDYADTLIYHKVSTYPPDTLNIAMLPAGYRLPGENPVVLIDTTIMVFRFDKNDTSVLLPQQIRLLSGLQGYVDQPVDFYVNGYADDSNNPVVNETLSNARAGMVSNIMRMAGIAESRIHVQGWADANPVAADSTGSDSGLNRRVEVVVKSVANTKE